MLVDGRPRDGTFQRKTGYVQQQDLHLHTTTVREALEFSALLRQPPQFSRAEKLAYVETVIDLLNMREYAEAIVGVPGEGLNVEQRKRLTIGVELAARPKLLLFLDEPTSGLDSQTSWSICNLMETLTKNGQAILAQFTNHLPCCSSGLTGSFYSPREAEQSISERSVKEQKPLWVILSAMAALFVLQVAIQQNTCSRSSELHAEHRQQILTGLPCGETVLNT